MPDKDMLNEDLKLEDRKIRKASLKKAPSEEVTKEPEVENLKADLEKEAPENSSIAKMNISEDRELKIKTKSSKDKDDSKESKSSKSKTKSQDKEGPAKEATKDKIERTRGSKRSSKELSPEIIEEIERRREGFLAQAPYRQDELKENIQDFDVPEWKRELLASKDNESVLYGEITALTFLEDEKRNTEPVFKVLYGDALVYIPPKDFLSSPLQKLNRPALNAIVGAKIPFIVTLMMPKRSNGPEEFLASRRLALEQKFLRQAHMVEESEIYPGTVLAVLKNYIWVECLGLDFRISRVEMDSYMVEPDLRKTYRIGDEIKLKVSSWDIRNDLIEVTAKTEENDPLDLFTRIYKKGDLVSGTVSLDPPGGYLVNISVGNGKMQGVFCSNTSWSNRQVSLNDKVSIRILNYWTDHKEGKKKLYVKGQLMGVIEKAMPGY